MDVPGGVVILHRRSSVYVAALLLVMPIALFEAAIEARADAASIIATMPQARSLPAAVAHGGAIYVIGGDSGSSYMDQILKFDLTAKTFAHVGTLPVKLAGASAVSDTNYIYVFGGLVGGTGLSDRIYRFEPTTGDTVELAARLPSPRYLTSAIFDGTSAYVFGGLSDSGYTAQIVRFNRFTGVDVAGSLPETNGYAGAVWTGSAAYIIAGYGTAGINDDIFVFYPGNSSSFHTGDKLAFPRYAVSATFDGTSAYVFGGTNGGSSYSEIVKYTPADHAVQVMGATLGDARAYSGAAFADGASYVFGGYASTYLATAVKYANVLRPTAPASLTATAGPGAGEIALAWEPPASNGGAAVTSYRIFEDGIHLAQVAGDVTTYTRAGLGEGVTRSYTVTATNSAGEGPASPSASATTFRRPSAPQDLLVEPGYGARDLVLTWGVPEDDGGAPILGYRIYRGWLNESSNSFLADVGNVLTFTDTTCGDTGTFCFYNVTARNVVGEGPSSDEEYWFIGSRGVANTLPPTNLSRDVGPQSTPAIGSQEFTTPPVSSPETCQVSVCHEETHFDGVDESTPGVGPIEYATDPVPLPRTCSPLNVICVGPFTIPSQRVGPTPPVDPVPIVVDAQTIPAACDAAGQICLDAVELAGSQLVTTPPIASVPLTPFLSVGLVAGGFEALAEPRVGETTSVPPTRVNVTTPFGDLPVDLCPETCPAPLAPNASIGVVVTVRIAVGNGEETIVVPLRLGTE